MPRKNSETKVFVGMSGGVDSSVSVYLLKKAGYDVTGVFIKVWSPDWLVCPWRGERRDAMRVAAYLDIPFATLDLTDEYKREVVDYMITEYKAGRTPNPDVMCNKQIKFGSFLRWAREHGADFVATGHYARLRQESSKFKSQNSNKLLTGKDKNKDQSYFLWTLTQDQLKHILFPVGGLTKPQVRKIAKKTGLPVAEKKDSQGICFLGPVDMKEFLSHYVKLVPGDVLDEAGKKIGRHSGALIYTIGQRHGFETTIRHSVFYNSVFNKPMYVVAKDMEKNTITVSDRRQKSDLGDPLRSGLEEVNWISSEPEEGKTYQARVRYRQPLQACRLEKFKIKNSKSQTWRVVFKESQVLAPGQSCVIYSGEAVLGGGIIK